MHATAKMENIETTLHSTFLGDHGKSAEQEGKQRAVSLEI